MLVFGNRLQYALDGDVLVVTPWMRAAFIFVGNGGETVAPRICFGEGSCPEFVRRWVGGSFAFFGGLHINGVDAVSIGGVGVADGEFGGVIFRLSHALGESLVLCFCLDDGELGVAINQHIICDVRLAASSATFDAACCDAVFAEDSAALDDAPSCGLQRGVNQLGSGFGFVHGRVLGDRINRNDCIGKMGDAAEKFMLVGFLCIRGRRCSPRTLLLQISCGAWACCTVGIRGMARRRAGFLWILCAWP